MASRPVFLPDTSVADYVHIESVEFEWHPGFSFSQKRKSIHSLHEAARKSLGITTSLEISSKSESELGRNLSAFNLGFNSHGGRRFTVEGLFQGSKVFENGGPYTDLYGLPAREVKKDPRLKESGQLLFFRLNEHEWPLEPKTVFYDWVYLNALKRNLELGNSLAEYDAFTDIEFNPKKSFNCQARSAALYVALRRDGKLNEALEDRSDFIALMSRGKEEAAATVQGDLRN